MTDVIYKELLPGVRLTAVHTNKFKTCLLGMTLLAPLDAATASANALIPMVLRRGTRSCPDLQALSAALDELYGGSVEPMVRKKGETQCVGFVGSFLDDAYAPDGAMLLEPAAALMGDLLLRPATEGGAFRADYTEGERANLIDRIRAQINDKRQYSMLRLAQLMCAGEAYGVDKSGDARSAAAVTPQLLWERYHKLLSEAPLELYFCGSAPIDRVEKAFSAALQGLPRATGRKKPECLVKSRAAEGAPAYFTDRLDVTQGKLAMGFRTGGVSAPSDKLPALMVFNAVFGGTTTSKLFMNVREKLSLCYFASSMLEMQKGIMLVSSGIEFDKNQRARDEILAQLDACKKGEIEVQELEGARASVMGTLRSSMDSHARLEDHWLAQAVAGLTVGPGELADRIAGVTLQQVVEVAGDVELETVYFLDRKEA
jgi:predicted Zn-dependent peptidase